MIDPIVLKYTVPEEPGCFALPLHKGSQILHLAKQGLYSVLWALSDSSQPLVGHDFVALHAGVPARFMVPPGNLSEHVGTLLLDDGTYVLHYFKMRR